MPFRWGWRWTLIGLCVLAVLSVAVYEFMPGFVTGKSLGYSVAGEAGGLTTLGTAGLPTCRERDEDVWRCTVDDPAGSGTTWYEVTERGWSCWEARLTGPGRGDGITWPASVEGCVKVGDNVRLSRRALDALSEIGS